MARCACCACCGREKDEAVYKPRSARGCTDLLCLILLICSWGGWGAITGLSIAKEPSLFYELMYGMDAYGQFCGMEGEATAGLPKLMYPDLDGDFESQAEFLATSPYWMYWKLNFTGLCVEECPTGVSLDAPTVYGGASYPVSSASLDEHGSAVADDGSITVPDYVYTFDTIDVLGHCIPQTNTQSAPTRRLCGIPNCTEAALLPELESAGCAEIPSEAEPTSAWDICGADVSHEVCKLQEEACSYELKLSTVDRITPDDWNDESTVYTAMLALYFNEVLGAWGSVVEARGVVALYGLGIPLLAGFAWAILLYFFAGLIIVTLFVLLVLAMLLGDVYLCIKAGWVPDDIVADASSIANSTYTDLLAASSDTYETYYSIAAVVGLVLTAIVIVFLLLSIKAIRRCIAVVKEVCNVFTPDGNGLPVVMFWPLIGLVFRLMILIGGTAALYFVAWPSVWNDTTTSTVLALCSIFCILWTLNWIKANEYCTMACAAAEWYVTETLEGNSGWCSVCKSGCDFGVTEMICSAWTIALKHLGSTAFGAAVLAICQVIRLILAACIKSAEEMTGNNLAAKLVLKCVQCCAWCFQKTIEFVSAYSYVFIGIRGTSFCVGCKDTFSLLASYPSQVAINQLVKKLLAIMMLVSTPLACALACQYDLDRQPWFYTDYDPFYPTVAVALSALLVSDAIATVFQCLIDTIYVSIFLDIDANKPPKYMSDSLRRAFGIDEKPGDGAASAGSTSTAKVAPDCTSSEQAQATDQPSAAALPFVPPPAAPSVARA